MYGVEMDFMVNGFVFQHHDVSV